MHVKASSEAAKQHLQYLATAERIAPLSSSNDFFLSRVNNVQLTVRQYFTGRSYLPFSRYNSALCKRYHVDLFLTSRHLSYFHFSLCYS